MDALAPRVDSHGDRMKAYEAVTDVRLDTSLPIYARIDGRSFSKFTKHMARPFDANMSSAMIEAASCLVEKTHANIAYTQSDEISLVFLADGPESDTIFSGRVLKLTSVLASLATALFTARIMKDEAFVGYRNRLPHFDCRVCQLPSKEEAANMFLWRYKDARKNAISMVAQANFSHKQLQGKHGGEMLEMLADRGVAFNGLPGFFRNGTFLKRRTSMRTLTNEEMAKIPENFRPTGPVERSEIVEIECENFLTMENREQFIFGEAL